MATTLAEREHRHFLQTYKRLPVEIDRAEGMYVYDRNGNRYLDFLGGIAVNSLGHCHQGIIAAIEAQAHRYAHVSNFFYQDAQIEFAEKLCALSGYDRVFLCNSGTEATDGAMKLARLWGHTQQQEKKEIIAFSGGFHGRGYAALSIMDKPKYKDGMGPFLPNTAIIPFNNVAAIRNAVGPATCALVLEYLQGEGGIREATGEFVQAIEELRQEFGFLVIADEIQAGAGRTGVFNSFDKHNVRPDIVTLAKGIGGGLPLGAILTTKALANVWQSGQHGTTFGGNALSCAAGSVVLEKLAAGLMAHVADSGAYLIEQLHVLALEFPTLIQEIRGAGAMVGVHLSIAAAPVVEMMLARRVIINATNETVLRLLPPLIYTREHTDELLQALRACLSEKQPQN